MRTNTYTSGDTDNRPGKIVGVQDEIGQAWCFECADREIRQAGEAAFGLDLYARDAARKRCSQCGRRIGEVQG